MNSHEFYMSRALDLANLGRGNVAPNPMVGCVIVHNNKIIGEGWHEVYGGAHAEVNAINSVKDKTLLPESILYVTLEPCNHFGKTPPCSLAIIKHQLKKIVVGASDPNPLVSGKGISSIKNSGIEVIEGVLKTACTELNKRFYTNILHKRPYVILKWAESADGFLAPENTNVYTQISDEFSMIQNHKWRTEESAILIGTNTALTDNPKLTSRFWTGKNPTRFVLDLSGRLPDNLNLYSDQHPTYTFTYEHIVSSKHNVLPIKTNQPLIPQLLQHLFELQQQSVIIEGGSKLLQSFIDVNLWDEARVFQSNVAFKKGIQSPVLPGSYLHEHWKNDTLKLYTNT